MTQVNSCLYNLDNIDLQTLYAEGSVLEAYISIDDKSGIIMEASGNTKEIKKPLIVKLMDFIRKCIDRVINTISDIAVKMKTAKAEYILIPYEYTKLKSDLIKMEDIISGIGKYVRTVETKQPTENDLQYLKNLTKEATFYVDKIRPENKSHCAIDRTAWLELRNKIRDHLTQYKDLKKALDSQANILSGSTSLNADCTKEMARIVSRITDANAKIMTAFTFSGLETAKTTKEEAKKAPKKVID